MAKELIKIKKVESLPYEVLNLHYDCFARKIHVGETAVVMHNLQLARGGAEMHIHEGSTHIFYVTQGTLNVKTDKDEDQFGPGSAFVIPAGTPHQVTSVDSDCIYISVTTPPADYHGTTTYSVE